MLMIDMMEHHLVHKNDQLEINVSVTSDVSGLFDGGEGFDELSLTVDQNATNGVIVDFSYGIQDEFNSAFIIPYDTNPSDVAFDINNWEKLLLTDNSDYGIITENVGVDITDIYDVNYFTTSQSVLTIDPGLSGNGIDRFDIDANSQIELSYASIKDIKTLDNASWINISESSSHDSGVLIYERLSDDGISIVSFTDRDGASPNLGETVQWSFNNGNLNDLDKYIVINKNDYSSAITHEEGDYIGNVF